MGAWWRSLHRLMYVLVILMLIHHALAVKPQDHLPSVYAVITAVFLLHRVVVRLLKIFHRKDDDGLEVFR